MSDPFKSIRAALAAARASLQATAPTTNEHTARIEAVENSLLPRHPDWQGDPKAAHAALTVAVSELQTLTRQQHATAQSGDALKPSNERAALPGVADAIERLEKARSQLVGTWQ